MIIHKSQSYGLSQVNRCINSTLVWVMDDHGGMGYGLSQVWVMDISISYPPSWWIQNAMGYHRLWVITVWVISGLTVCWNTGCLLI